MSIKDAFHDYLAGDATIYALVDNRVYPEVSPGVATGMLFVNAVPTAGNTVTIDTQTYTWAAAPTTTANEVKIGGTVDLSIANLIAAIGLTGTPGTDYGSATVKHSTAFALQQFTSTMTLISKLRKQKAVALTEVSTDSLTVWQNATARVFPYIALHRINVDYGRHMLAADGMAKANYQVDIWSPSSVDTETVMEAVLALTHGKESGNIGDPAVFVRSMSLESAADEYFEPSDDSEIGLFRTRMDVTIWHSETVPSL